MIPFNQRSNKILYIHFRQHGLERDNYCLKIMSENGEEYTTPTSQKTLLPKFEVDNRMSNFIYENSRNKKTNIISIIKITLQKCCENDLKENIVEFTVDLGELRFYSNEIFKTDSKSYPSLIFEMLEGFFVTKEHFANTYFRQQFTTSLNMQKSSSSLRELKFSKYNEKFKEYDFHLKQYDILIEERLKEQVNLDKQIQLTDNVYRKYITRNILISNIDKLRKQKFDLDSKIKYYHSLSNTLLKLINLKKSDLQINSNAFVGFQENLKEKTNAIEKYKKKIEKYKIIYNSLKLKKLADICYIFFNKACQKMYFFPTFYDGKSDKNFKIEQYEKHSKEFSVMLGVAASIINHLSKVYDITLKYPLFINGSKSYIVHNRTEFISLHYILKNGEKNIQFEFAINLMNDNLFQLLKFFKIEIGNETKESDNFFMNFLRFYQYISKLFTKTKLILE